MSVESNTITLFVLDISARMGESRTVEDRVVTPNNSVERRKRTTTHLQWVCQFVSARIAEIILRGLKTTRVGIVTYGSPRTNNSIPGIDDYNGIDEIVLPALPTLDTLDLVQCLRAVHPDQRIKHGDPLAALVDAIQLSADPHKGGIKDSQRNSWKRTVYLVTDAKAEFGYNGADAISDKINQENIDLRLLGVDFDEALNPKPDDSVKCKNERFWKDFLAGIPNSGFATAASAIEQASMPNVQLTRPAPTKTTLTFGDPNDLASRSAFQIAIALYKMTDPARPMTQSKISKLARESAQAAQERQRDQDRRNDINPTSTPSVQTKEEDSSLIYRADLKREFFLLDQLAAVANANKQPEALPPDSEANFTRAWKLGASLIPVPDEAFGSMDTRKGMEVVHFFSASAYRREYNVDQIWYVFADHAQLKAQLQLSTLIRAMVELDVLAVVRLVRKDGAEPELGILKPRVEEHNEFLFYSRAPFREDLRRFPFPPLDRIVTTDGTEIRQAPTIPDDQDQKCMDAFVDSMELPDEWFDVLDSYNPAIHGLKTAVRHRFVHPDADYLPGPHPELVKYLEAPREVQERSTRAAHECRERFRIAYVPPKGNADRKKRTLSAMQQDTQHSEASKAARAHEAEAKAAPARADESDATEDEAEASAAPAEVQAEAQAAAPRRAAPLLRLQDPVSHLHELVESDDVTRAMQSLLATIDHLVGERSYERAAQCMQAGKKVAQEYEEAITWNAYIRTLKTRILAAHRSFWDNHLAGKLEYGLVAEEEDEAGQSDVTPEDAREFVETEYV